MPKFELTILIALAFLCSFIIGWISSRIFQNINHVRNLESNEINDLNNDLLNAEEERDQTIAYVRNREKELNNQLGQVKAELEAAMDGLGAARREAADLRKKLMQ